MEQRLADDVTDKLEWCVSAREDEGISRNHAFAFPGGWQHCPQDIFDFLNRDDKYKITRP